MPVRLFARLLACGATVLLSSCVYVPRSVQVYDPACRGMVDHLVLEGGQVAAIQHCENQGCVALIVGASVVTAATVVVSGGIVVVGNMAYWFERQARCPGVGPGMGPGVGPGFGAKPASSLGP